MEVGAACVKLRDSKYISVLNDREIENISKRREINIRLLW